MTSEQRQKVIEGDLEAKLAFLKLANDAAIFVNNVINSSETVDSPEKVARLDAALKVLEISWTSKSLKPD
ncbi:hypothetical protein [Nostoc sp. DedQUE09]|uniref:hypothetical protein n=1 Tax=Nostoc sp. DedQUE09 TaxID=3075394 RepID=UPI002AD404C0|nr:hypothetical protein [Nostoc sp. DedQUE09]MDZ7952972.1 hypothetical protein [Nostoc sp. DedQUE09]